MDLPIPNPWTLLALFIAGITLLWTVPQLVSHVMGAVPEGQKRRIKKAWKEAAERIGFRVRPGPVLKGTRRGRSVWVSLEDAIAGVQGWDDGCIAEVRVELDDRRWKEGVVLRPRALWAKLERVGIGDLAEAEGRRPVEIGDPKFDRDFFVGKGIGEEAKNMLRGDEVQSVLRRLAKQLDLYEIRPTGLSVETRRAPDNADQLVRLIDRCVDAADALDDVAAGEEIDRPSAPLFPSRP